MIWTNIGLRRIILLKRAVLVFLCKKWQMKECAACADEMQNGTSIMKIMYICLIFGLGCSKNALYFWGKFFDVNAEAAADALSTVQLLLKVKRKSLSNFGVSIGKDTKGNGNFRQSDGYLTESAKATLIKIFERPILQIFNSEVFGPNFTLKYPFISNNK